MILRPNNFSGMDMFKVIMEEGTLPKEVMKWSPPGRRNEVDPNLPGWKGLED